MNARAVAFAAFAALSTIAGATAAVAGNTRSDAAIPPHPLVPSTAATSAASLSTSASPSRGHAPVGPAARLVHDGALLYGTHCATCHAADLKGSPDGPSLEGAGGAAVDFYLTTGRMPLSVPGSQANHEPAHFDARQIAALDAFVDARASQTTPIPLVHERDGLLQRGRTIFESNCQACHGAGAQGATVGRQWTAVALGKATPREIGEAVRVGPGVMPRFAASELTSEDLDAVATYVRYLATAPQNFGGTTMDYLGPVAEGFVGAFAGVGTLFFVIFYTGTKADGRRLHEGE